MEFAGSNRKRLSLSDEKGGETADFDPCRGSVDRKNIHNCFFDTNKCMKLTYTLAMYKITKKKKEDRSRF